MGTDGHEVPRAFDELGRPLSAPLVEMLSELPKHRTERRGCGYTQSTRYLAPHVNRRRRARSYAELALFVLTEHDRRTAVSEPIVADDRNVADSPVEQLLDWTVDASAVLKGQAGYEIGV